MRDWQFVLWLLVMVWMHETPNSYLSAYLVMVGIRALTISHNAPILSLQRLSLGRSKTLLKSSTPTHAHLMRNWWFALWLLIMVRMRETPNSYLNNCLIIVIIRALTISHNAPILSLQRLLLGRSETLLKPSTYPCLVNE
jgi:hypothetical protein